MFLFVYRKLVWQSWEFVSKIGQDQEVNMTLCLSATLWLEVGIYRRSRNSELSAACKRLQICLSELVVQCFFQISIRALTYIVPHLEFAKRSVPMKLDVCVTKTALPTTIQCVVVTEQLTTANVFTSCTTAEDWTTILFTTRGAVRLNERLHSKTIIQWMKLKNCDVTGDW